MADTRLVLGIFADEAAADEAAESLLAWEKDNDVVRRPAGVLVADDDGRIKEHKLGQRSGAKGAGIGVVLAVIAPPTLLAGLVGGGILGHFHHKGLGLTDEDRERIAAELAGGKAAVGVLVEADGEASMISHKLTELGGAMETHMVSDEALEAMGAAGVASAEGTPVEATPVEPEAPPAEA